MKNRNFSKKVRNSLNNQVQKRSINYPEWIAVFISLSALYLGFWQFKESVSLQQTTINIQLEELKKQHFRDSLNDISENNRFAKMFDHYSNQENILSKTLQEDKELNLPVLKIKNYISNKEDSIFLNYSLFIIQKKEINYVEMLVVVCDENYQPYYHAYYTPSNLQDTTFASRLLATGVDQSDILPDNYFFFEIKYRLIGEKDFRKRHYAYHWSGVKNGTFLNTPSYMNIGQTEEIYHILKKHGRTLH